VAESEGEQLSDVDVVELISRTAHDFKNPLAVVMGCGDLLAWMAEEAGHAKMKDLADDVVNAAIRLKGFADTMVAYARLEHGERPEVGRVPAGKLAEKIASEFMRLARRIRVELVLEIEPEIAVAADRDWLGRALFNLLDHALRYAPSDSVVTVKAHAHAGMIRFSVGDAGPVVRDPAAIFRAQPGDRSQERQSAGLALAYARRCIVAMGGTIGVGPGPAETGAIFTIDLPAA
jgi:signal transduction histidine kinase